MRRDALSMTVALVLAKMDTNNPACAAKPASQHHQSPYYGDHAWDDPSKIVIGIDIGTTHSGVVFTFLETGMLPIKLQ